METTEGIVFRVHTKDWQGKNLYSVKLDGTGDNEWYRMGETRHEGVIEEGFKVKIGFAKDKNGNLQLERVKLLAKGEPVKSSGRGSRGGAAKGGAGAGMSKQDWAEKDLTIQYQSARNAAIEMVGLLVSHEIVKLPAKNKAAERLTVVEGYVDLYTARFYLDTAGKGAVGRSAEELDTQSDLPADTPDDAPASTDDGWDDNTSGGDDNDW